MKLDIYKINIKQNKKDQERPKHISKINRLRSWPN